MTARLEQAGFDYGPAALPAFFRLLQTVDAESVGDSSFNFGNVSAFPYYTILYGQTLYMSSASNTQSATLSARLLLQLLCSCGQQKSLIVSYKGLIQRKDFVKTSTKYLLSPIRD